MTNVFDFDELGNFTRLGDCFSGGQKVLPFCLHADGVADFAKPSVSGRGARRTLRWKSADGKLEVAANYEWNAETGILSRRDTVRNLTKKPIVLRKYNAQFPFAPGEYEVYAQRSLWGRESQGAWTSLFTGSLTLGSREGRWCEGATPFAVLRDLYAERALAFLVFPEGDWLLRFAARTTGGSGRLPDLMVEAGLSDDRLALELAPGENWEAPEILIQLLPSRDAFSGTAAMNRYLNRRFPAEPSRYPVVYNTWLDRMQVLDTARLERQLTAAKRCGCEVFVVDYGWYEDRDSFTRLNDWDECTDRAFFGKMKRFADKVRKAGLGFGFWVEMEFFFDESDMVRKHPDWFFASSHPHIVCPKTWLPEVEDYLVESLAKTIRRYGAIYVKNDMNHSQGYEPARLNRSQQGVFRVFARLREMFPGVTFENCSSGGLRMAAGRMLCVNDNCFISDNASPLENLRMFQGALPRFTPGRIYHWFVGSELRPEKDPVPSYDAGVLAQPNSATWLRMRTWDLDFGLLCNLTGQIGYSCDLASFSPEHQDRIARYSAFYKKYRTSFLRSEAYLLTPPEDFEKMRGWLAFQLADPETDTHFLYVFHSVYDGDARRIFRLKGLDPAKKYKISAVFPEPGAAARMTGRELMEAGFTAEIPVAWLDTWHGRLWLVQAAKA